jgi:hypothetical protein
MPGPDATPPEVSLTRAEKEKLLQQMYSLPHWIAIVRLFAYETLPMDQARKAIKPIAEEYGKDKVAQACETLVEIVPEKEPFARLKTHIRRMAFQILGPPPEQNAAVRPECIKESPVTTRSPKSCRSDGPPNVDCPVKQPRHFVLGRFQAWLEETGLAYVAIDDVKRTTPAVQPFVSGFDFIVLRDEAKLLVTVRPHLQAKHLNAMRELQKLFGSDYRCVRLWPYEGPEGWRWQEHIVDCTADS